MNRISRPTALKIAAVISFLLGATNLLISLPYIMQGAATVNQAYAGPPYVVELALFVTAIISLVAAYGTWKQMRWGILLTIAVNAINVLAAAPGILFAPRPWGPAAAGLVILLSTATIVLCLLPDRQTQAAA